MSDFLRIEDELSEEERLIKDSTRRFVEETVLPGIEQHFENHTFPEEFPKKAGEQGLLGMFLPEEYGGCGTSYVAYGLACEELERGDSGVRSFCSVQSSLVMLPIFKYGSEGQRTRYLKKLAAADLIGCFGLTEPDFGSNPAGMRTRAVKDGTSYQLNGTKRWITNGDIADIAIVWAKDDAGEFGAFLVERGTPGFTQVEMKRKFSLRASHTGELILENCRIPEENRLPEAIGLKAALACLDSARFGIMWGALGAAEACYQCALSYAKERVQFAKPIAAYQLVQSKLVWMLTEITKGRLLALHVGRLRDNSRGHHTHVSMGKLNNVGVALEIARTARDILGANGITTEYPVIRHMLNLESVNTYEGTADIHRLVLGKEITGFSAIE